MTMQRWTLVYTGFSYNPHSNDKSHTYQRIIDGAALGKRLNFKKELLAASPGAILEVDIEEAEDGAVSVYGKGRTYTDQRWLDEETVLQWTAMDRAATAQAQAASKSKVDQFEKNLAPLRVAYSHLPGPQRAILIAQVVQFITKP